MAHKSETLKQVALLEGWKAEVQTKLDRFNQSNDLNDIEWHIYAMREKETIHAIYLGDRFERAIYKYGDHVLKLFWRWEVIKLLTGKPDPAKFHRNIPIGEGAPLERSVPWEHDSPAVDIMLAVLRKEIRWIRKFDGQICTAVVNVNLKERGSAKHFRVYEGKKGRVIEWADALGFHAVAIDQIIDVT
jgi:hypothetical protein